MIVIARANLKALKAGRTLTIPDPDDAYHPGRTYALGTRHGQEPACYVDVIAADDDGVRIRLTANPPRMLARSSQYGYTDRVALAMRGEPEAITRDELALFTRDALERHRQRQTDEAARQHARSIAIRLKDAARRGDNTAYQTLADELSQLAAPGGTLLAKAV